MSGKHEQYDEYCAVLQKDSKTGRTDEIRHAASNTLRAINQLFAENPSQAEVAAKFQNESRKRFEQLMQRQEERDSWRHELTLDEHRSSTKEDYARFSSDEGERSRNFYSELEKSTNK